MTIIFEKLGIAYGTEKNIGKLGVVMELASLWLDWFDRSEGPENVFGICCFCENDVWGEGHNPDCIYLRAETAIKELKELQDGNRND